MSGWASVGAGLGDIFGGGDYSRARDAGISDAARMEAAILKARQARDAEVARNTAVDRLVASGVPRNVAQRLSLYMRAGVNPEQYSGAQEDYQHINQGNELFQQAGQPDTDLGAFFRRGQVYSGDFAPATKVSGGVAYSPSATPGAQTIKATPVGLSKIFENQAQAGKYRHEANAPPEAPDFHALNSTAAKYFSAPLYDQDGNVRTDTYGNVVYGFSPEKYGEFASWWATSGIPDQNAALAVYIRQQGIQAAQHAAHDPLGLLGGSHGAIQR